VALIKPMFGPAKPMTSGRKPDLLIIEDKGSGISLRQSLSKEGIHAYPYNPGRADKLARLHMVSHLFARGYFWLPESEKRPGRPRTWVEPALDQLCSFRGGGSIKHDDFVDVFSQAARVIMDKGLLSGVKRESKSVREAPAPPKPRVNPYAI
jgi:predicted phage terminase large subunit-like protein